MEPLEKAIHYYTVSNGTFCFVLSEWSVHENVQHECTVWGNYLCFQTMVRFHLAGNPVSHSEFLSDELKIFTAGTEGATIEIERLKQYSKVCDSRQTMSSCIKKAEKLLFGSYPPPHSSPLLFWLSLLSAFCSPSLVFSCWTRATGVKSLSFKSSQFREFIMAFSLFW